MIHVVTASAAGEDGAALAWVHTHGLGRCGRVELEILEVPAPRAAEAAALVSEVAALLLEGPLPLPGEPMAIGPDLEITLQPWQEAVRYLAEGAPGCTTDRSGPADGHRGPRAVICGAEPVGSYRRLWAWPRAVLDRRAGGGAAGYMSTRATARQAALAQAHWGRFSLAFARSGGGEGESARFIVKAAFEVEDGGGDREHLWFQATAVDAGCVRGRLLNEPVAAGRLRRGELVSIDPGRITDWRIETPRGSAGPHDHAEAFADLLPLPDAR